MIFSMCCSFLCWECKCTFASNTLQNAMHAVLYTLFVQSVSASKHAYVRVGVFDVDVPMVFFILPLSLIYVHYRCRPIDIVLLMLSTHFVCYTVQSDNVLRV